MIAQQNGRPGIGVDAKGNAAVDPTANVLSLVEAAVTRLNDLREADNRRIAELEAAHERRDDQAHRYESELRRIETDRSSGMQLLHVAYQEKLAMAESKRIDAIRAVDVAAVATASDRAVAQAQVLANQVAASADALRSLVASTQAALATQLNQMSATFTERLAALEKAQYESAGKSGVADPMMQELMMQVRGIATQQEKGSGKNEGIGISWNVVVVVAGLVVAAFTVPPMLNNNKQPIVIQAPSQPAQTPTTTTTTAPAK